MEGKGEPSLIRDVLERYFSRHRKLQYEVKVREAVKKWDIIIDDYIRHHTEAVLVKDRTLYVNTTSSVLAGELSLRERELVGKLNESLKLPLIEKIVFKSGFVRGHGRKKKKAGESGREFTIETLKKIDNTVRSIEEDDLRKILKKFLKSTVRRGKDQ